jgi:carboxylesterase
MKSDIYYEGGKSGFLLFHGIMKTPDELSELAKCLHGYEFTVFCPLLPGHGTCPKGYETCWQDFLKFTVDDWKVKALSAYDWLKKRTDKIYTGGISLGANLSFYLSNERSVSGIVSMGGVFSLGRVVGIASMLGKRTENILSKKEDNNVTYHHLPISNLLRMKDFVDETKNILKEIDVPMLVFQSKSDDVVDPRSAKNIIKTISSREKELIWVGSGEHGILNKDGSKVCCKAIIKFLTQIGRR